MMAAQDDKTIQPESRAVPILKMVVGILILLSDCYRLAKFASGGATEPLRWDAAFYGHALLTFLLAVVWPIWWIASATKQLRRSAPPRSA